MNTKSPLFCLVDGHHGIYTWYVLAKRYPLFDSEGTRFSGLATQFNPDEDDCWVENVDRLDSNGLFVKDAGLGRLCRVTQGESGDIFAIHPDAKWDEDADNWVFPTQKTPTLKPATTHCLIITNEYGTEVRVSDDPMKLKATAVKYAREWWEKDRADFTLGDDHSLYTDDEVLDGYFENNETESFLITKAAVLS